LGQKPLRPLRKSLQTLRLKKICASAVKLCFFCFSYMPFVVKTFAFLAITFANIAVKKNLRICGKTLFLLFFLYAFCGKNLCVPCDNLCEHCG
jgi:hypothetical protein